MAAREREYDDEDDRPRRKPRPSDDFEEEDRPRRPRPRDEFEEEDRPRRRPASRDEEFDDEDDRPVRKRRPRDEYDEDDDDFEERPRRRRRRRGVAEPSGMVTALAVINYVYGGLGVLGGLLVLVAGSWFMGIMGGVAADPRLQVQGPAGQRAAAGVQGIMALGAAFFVIIGIVVLVVAALYILAGYGLQQRRQWGRILAIVLGVINALFAFFGLFSLPRSVLAVIIYAAYAGLTLGVLFQPQYAEEFE